MTTFGDGVFGKGLELKTEVTNGKCPLCSETTVFVSILQNTENLANETNKKLKLEEVRLNELREEKIKIEGGIATHNETLKQISENDVNLKMLRSPNLWPEQPLGLRSHWEQCYKELEDLGSTILHACALALGLPERWFEQHTDGHFSILSALHYPAQIENPKPGQLRAGAHTDFDVLTIISTDDAPGGLQIMAASGNWVDVPWIPKTFVVNVGDLLARWSNDRWKSTLHRVVNPPRQLAQNSRRLTIGYFQQVNPHTLIEALPGTTSDHNPAKYSPITAGEHHNEKFLRQANAASRLALD